MVSDLPLRTMLFQHVEARESAAKRCAGRTIGGDNNNRPGHPANRDRRRRWHQRLDGSGIRGCAESLVRARDEFELPLSALRVGILNCWPRLESPSTECWQLGLIRRVFECHFDRVVAGVNHAGESKKQWNNESPLHRSNEKEISHALALSNITAGVRDRADANRTREITPLCGKPKSREQNRCTSGSVSRAP